MAKLCSLCTAILVALGIYAGHPVYGQGKDFKIGAVVSLSGFFAGPAKDSMDGINAWIKERGLPGRKVAIQTLDDETNPVGASNAFRRVASDPDVSLIYAIVPSGSVLAIKSLASEFKVPIISAGAADSIGFPADPWLFKVAPAVRDFMITLAEYAKSKGFKRLAMLNASDAFGQSEIGAMRELAPKYGLEIVAAETYGGEDTNFNAQLTRIRAANPEIFYNGATGRASVLTFKQAKQMEIKSHLVMGQSVVAQFFFEGIGGAKEADGVMVPIQLGSFGPSADPAAAALYKELEKGLGRTPVYFNTFGYDVGLITEAGIKGSDGSRHGIRDALEKVKDLAAVNGPVTYTDKDHTGQNFRSIGMGVLDNGKPVRPK